jgi:heme-degrading monooxygenase HmoA
MYIIVWEFQVKAAHMQDFEKNYGRNGTWAELFQRVNGYLGTELLRSSEDSLRYITIDRWASTTDYELFLSKWKREYEQLDAQCTELTEKERWLGNFESAFDL